MFDCGNSTGGIERRHKKYSSCASVASSASKEYSRSRHQSSKRYNEHDLLCTLLEDLRYSGRVGYTDDRYRRYEKAYESRKSKPRCIKEKPSLTFDGGTSINSYTRGPIIDFGTSEKTPEPLPDTKGNTCINIPIYDHCPGSDNECDDKIIFDGGTA